MQKNKNNGQSGFAVTAKQTATRRNPSFKWARIEGVRTKVTLIEWDKLLSEHQARAAGKAKLEKHEGLLKDFVSLFDEDAEYSRCVENFQTEYAERLQLKGIKDFSPNERQTLIESIQEFQGYSEYWGKALKPFLMPTQ